MEPMKICLPFLLSALLCDNACICFDFLLLGIVADIVLSGCCWDLLITMNRMHSYFQSFLD